MKLANIARSLIVENERAGRCFELAANAAIKSKGSYIIARVKSKNKQFLHAFVKLSNGKYFEPEHNIEIGESQFQQFQPKILLDMEWEKVAGFLLKHKSFPYPEKLGLS